MESSWRKSEYFAEVPKETKIRSGDYDYHGSESFNNKLFKTLVRFIPEDLILSHILPKLPVKSLIRFKSVAKSWDSTISTPEFAKYHFNCYSSPPQFIYVDEIKTKRKSLVRNEETRQRVYLLPYDEPTNRMHASIPLDFINYNDVCVKLVGSCNGLVCIYTTKNTSYPDAFVVWNPATRQHHKIGMPASRGYDGDFEAYGFGYSSKLDDYKIVCYQEPDLAFHVYSLNSGEWRRLSTSMLMGYQTYHELDGVPVVINDAAVVINDDFYWIDVEYDDQVFVFNLVTEQLERKPEINWLSEYLTADVFQMKGCLWVRCCSISNDSFSDIWMLKEPNDWNSWQKLFTLNTSRGLIYLSSNGKCMVKDCLGQLKLVEPTQEALERALEGTDSGSRKLQATEYVESLISPFGSST